MGDPFVFILLLFLLGTTGVFACLPGFTFGEQTRLFRDQALALAFAGGCLAATLGASRLITDDTRQGAVPVIMSRPVSRSAFVFGKWAGLVAGLFVLLASAAVAYLWGTRLIYHEHFVERLGLIVYGVTVLATLVALTARHYLFKGTFVCQANVVLPAVLLVAFGVLNVFGYDGRMPATYGALVDWSTLQAHLCVFLALLVFSAVTCCFAVLFDHAMLMIVAIVLFFGGLVMEWCVGLLPLSAVRSLCHLVLPNWQIYWIADRVADHGSVDVGALLSLAVHSVCQAVLFLLIGTRFFQRREITGAF